MSLHDTLMYKRKALEYIKENRKLPPVFKKNWLADLRSGEYKQVTGALNKKNEQTGKYGYCCLGVACKTQRLPDDLLLDYGTIDNSIANAAKKRKKNIPKIIQEDSPVSEYLVYCNDTLKWSFKQIANWVEKNL